MEDKDLRAFSITIDGKIVDLREMWLLKLVLAHKATMKMIDSKARASGFAPLASDFFMVERLENAIDWKLTGECRKLVTA